MNSTLLVRLEALLKSDLYIEIYDALSLSAIEVHGSQINNFDNSPKMEGLRRLSSDIFKILNEIQSISENSVSNLKNDLKSCEKLMLEAKERNSQKMYLSGTTTLNDNMDDDGEEEEEFDLDDFLDNPEMSKSRTVSTKKLSFPVIKSDNQKWEENAKLVNDTILAQLKYDLQRFYGKAMKLVDQKLDCLLITRRIIDYYRQRIISIAIENNITSAALRAQLVVDYHCNRLLDHKIFKTSEVEL